MKFHVVLTKEDADIICFKNSQPSGQFNPCIRKIIAAALNGKIAEIPMRFQIDTTISPTQTKIELSDETVKRCRERLGFRKGSFTTGVKAEIRKCIAKNLVQHPCKRCGAAEIEKLIESSLIHMRRRESELANVPDKDKRLHSSWQRTLNWLTNNLKERG